MIVPVAYIYCYIDKFWWNVGQNSLKIKSRCCGTVNKRSTYRCYNYMVIYHFSDPDFDAGFQKLVPAFNHFRGVTQNF